MIKNAGNISLEEVSVSFTRPPGSGAMKKAKEIKALGSVSFAVEPGERIAIVGASGAGKSTLFKALTRNVATSGGRIAIGGRDLYGLSRSELKKLRRRIGTVHQSYNLIPQLPAGINASLGQIGDMSLMRAIRTLFTGPDAALSARVHQALEQVALAELASTRTANLSGGQQQRVAVARLLVQEPQLILADEPFAAVDPATTERVLDSLIDLNEKGSTLLVNLHDVDIARRFPRVIALKQGHLVFDGSTEKLTDEVLADIYAGDSMPRTPEPDREPSHYPRILEGQDGITSH